MPLNYNKDYTKLAKELRKNMTKEEKHLWYDCLRLLPVKFYKQKQIGDYIVDFYCEKAKLIIELDGSQHYEEDIIQYDKERTRYFKQIGLQVKRFTNIDINNNFDGVCESIIKSVKFGLEYCGFDSCVLDNFVD
jgi:very-short-patch-repair endonuclease